MKQIIIINGCGGVGKDTFVEMCAKRIPTINYSSVKEIKEIATMLGWNGGKEEKDRKFLSDLKLLASEYSDFSFKCISKQIEDFMSQNEKELMFIHIRDIPEIKRVVNTFFNVKTLLVVSNKIDPITSNVADANVALYNYDFIIDNSYSLESLDKESKNFIKLLQETYWTNYIN